MKLERLFAGARATAGCLLLACMAGCAEQQVLADAAKARDAHHVDQAIRGLEEAAQRYPDSLPIRAELIRTRSQGINDYLAEAASAMATGRMDDARRALDQVLQLDPQNARARALQSQWTVLAAQDRVLGQAREAYGQGHPDTALRLVREALKDEPHHPGLLGLQRRIESEQRQRQFRAGVAKLDEMRAVSLDFREASLRTVLDVVSRYSGVSFVLDKDVRPDVRVTVFLRQAKVEDALDLIASTSQLAVKVVDPKTVLIYPNTPDKQREYQEQIVRLFYLENADVRGAASFVKSLLKIREPVVDERSNMLALRDSAENIELAERLLRLYDSAEPEVLLDVEVLEISSTRLTDVGINLPNSFSLSLLPAGSAEGLTLNDLRGINRSRIGLSVGDVLVNLRREVGDFKTLAKPQIRTRNREKAKILVGDKIPVITSTTSQVGFVADSVNYLDVGMKLDVEPTIYANDDVAIKIDMEVSSLGTATKTASGTLAYQIGTRNASTFLRLRDGETQLLAGLISRDERTSASKVPGIGDLPLLGRLFSDQTDTNNRTELVLAITPHVIRNIRRPDASEAELWIGTEQSPKLRQQGGLAAASVPEPRPAGAGDVAAGAMPAPADAASRTIAPDPAAITRLQWQGPADVKVGETFEMKVAINAVEPLRGMPLDFGFDPERLELVDVNEGDFFRQGGTPTSFSRGSDGRNGKLSLGVLRTPLSGSFGDGTVLVLKFKARSAGKTELRVERAQGLGVTGPVTALALPAPKVLQVQ